MNLIHAVLEKFTDPVGLDRPLWFDVSYWQGVISAEAMLAAGAAGCAARAVVGSKYSDPYFAANWAELGGTMLYRTSYGVYVPGQRWLEQLDAWYRVAPVRDVIPRVIDLEIQDANVPAVTVAVDVWKWVEEIRRRDGVRPLIYSRANLVDQWIEPYWSAEQINGVYWWMAQYTWDRVREHAGPPDVSRKMRRENVVLHQTADKKPAPAGMVRSKSVDWDRWELGDIENMRQFIGINWGDKLPVPEPEPAEDGLWYRVLVDGLNIRVKPTTSAAIIGKLPRDDEVQALDVGGANSWIQIDRGWVCVQTGGKTYLEKMDG